MFSVLQHSTFTVQILYKVYSGQMNCTYSITQELPIKVQLRNNTAHLLYKYCTKCTVCNWTVLTVITQNLPLHVQLHNSTAHLLYKYCTKCTVCNWTVLTVITHKLLLHVQLHNSTTHLLYKYRTVCNWTVLTVILQKLPQMFSCTTSHKLSSWYLLRWSADCTLILYFYIESHIRRLDTSTSRYWLANVTWQFYVTTWCYYGNRHTVQTEGNTNICYRNGSAFEFFVKPIVYYSTLLVVLLALRVNICYKIRWLYLYYL